MAQRVTKAKLQATAKKLGFDGSTYDHKQDGPRLTGQLGEVWELVKDGEWWTLKQLAKKTGGSEAACSARLRDLRKPRFGRMRVDRVRQAEGWFEYRVVL